MINVLLCGNNKVFDGMLTELISMTNRTNEPIRCYIFTAKLTRIKKEYQPLSKEEADFLDEVVKAKNPDSEVILVDVTSLYEQEFMKSPNESAYCTPYTLLRLLVYCALFTETILFIPTVLFVLDKKINLIKSYKGCKILGPFLPPQKALVFLIILDTIPD